MLFYVTLLYIYFSLIKYQVISDLQRYFIFITGRVLVHEWGHYRWGLFDEYADPVGDPDNYQEFYWSGNTQQWEGVR